MKTYSSRKVFAPVCSKCAACEGDRFAARYLSGRWRYRNDPAPGSGGVQPAEKSYTVSGSGDNMWFGEDDFHFVWTKMSGDVALTAVIAFIGATGNNHRKAGPMHPTLHKSSAIPALRGLQNHG